MMDKERLYQIYKFLQAAEQLKNTLRSGYTSAGRRETTADHSWRLCLMVMCFENQLHDIDFLTLIKLCVIHDLGEAISGDIPATEQDPTLDKSLKERDDFIELCSLLPADLQKDMLALWDEYDQKSSQEAVLAKGFDKIETIMQHLIGDNPIDFDYKFNLTYGQDATSRHPILSQMRGLIDDNTREKLR